MGDVRPAPLVTPLVAMLASDAAHFDAARPLLEELLGPAEVVSDVFPFDKTEYYRDTMGPSIVRGFYVFERLADPAALPDWKHAAHRIEASLRLTLAPSGVPHRPINIDPGYLAGSKLVLASTKDFAHRIYLRDGIFAEITLNFRGDAWESHHFTFPDFKSGMYDAFLRKARDRHLKWVKEARR
ncbi:MAG TPA: DUF4416 family protein [Planctomycetota bacterium]|nr:DUF4416 family protein [Planctomycetota bacterium]